MQSGAQLVWDYDHELKFVAVVWSFSAQTSGLLKLKRLCNVLLLLISQRYDKRLCTRGPCKVSLQVGCLVALRGILV